MQTSSSLLGQQLDLSGPVNFRDVGGYRTTDGQQVRRGQVFRSDGLWALSESDVAHLLSALGLRTVVDLRTEMEIDRYGPGPLDDSGVTFHRVTFFDERLRPDLPADGSWTLDDLYLFLIRDAGSRVASVLELLLSDDAHPAVVHCTAGKDRTGVVVALLLSLLGVCDDDVAEDYASTARVMPVFTERARSFLEELGREAPAFSPHVHTADREIMLRLLAAIRDEFGSIEEWAGQSGLSSDAIASARELLLEDGDD